MANEYNRRASPVSISENGLHCAGKLTDESRVSATITVAKPTASGGGSGPSGMSATQNVLPPNELVEVASGSGGATRAGSMATGCTDSAKR